MAKAIKSTRPAADGAALSSYTVLSTLLHDGVIYRKNGTVELTQAEALPLLRRKVVAFAEADSSEESI